jgi:hypothetical protein
MGNKKAAQEPGRLFGWKCAVEFLGMKPIMHIPEGTF